MEGRLVAALTLLSLCVLVSGFAVNAPAKQTHENLTQAAIDYTSIESVKKRCPELEEDYVKDLVAAYTAIHPPSTGSDGQGMSALDLLYAAKRKPAAGNRQVKKSKKQGKKKTKKSKKSKKSKKQGKKEKKQNKNRRTNKRKQTHGASNRRVGNSKQDSTESGKQPAKEADKEPEKDATCERLDALEPYVNLFLLLTQKGSQKTLDKDLEGSKKVDSVLKKFIEHQLSP